jgi:hypothetical protein
MPGDQGYPAYTGIDPDGRTIFQPPGFVRDGSGAQRGIQVIGQFHFAAFLNPLDAVTDTIDVGVDLTGQRFVPFGAPNFGTSAVSLGQEAVSWAYGYPGGSVVAIALRNNDDTNGFNVDFFFCILLGL